MESVIILPSRQGKAYMRLLWFLQWQGFYGLDARDTRGDEVVEIVGRQDSTHFVRSLMDESSV